MRPRFITDLTSFEAIVKLGETPEGGCLDFKERVEIGSKLRESGSGLPENKKIENQLELCRDVSQFANTDGGCLLIGVSETQSAVGVKVARAICPVPEAEKLRQQIEDTLSLYTVPSTFRRTLVPINIPGKGVVLALNVPASERPVLVWNRRQQWMQCYRRTSHGKVALNPAELEALLMDKARAVRLRLDRLVAESSAIVEIHSGVWEESLPSWTGSDAEQVAVTLLRDYRASISVIGESEFTITISLKNGTTVAINVPYGFVEDVWMGESGAVTLSLTRKLGMSSKGQRLYLERRPAGT